MSTRLLDRLMLTNKIAVVTGGAGGMGTAIASCLLDLGCKVVLADVSGRLAAIAAEIGADHVQLDITDSASVDAAINAVVENHGRIDIFIANAGIAYDMATEDHDDATWRKVMSVNLDGAFYSIRAAGRHMIVRGEGSIVAISSTAGIGSVRPEKHIGYDVSKAAVGHMCRNLAVEWADRGIRVNAVAPAYTATKMLTEVGESQPETMRQWLDDMPFGRLMEPREIGDAVAFLVSGAASGITGHELVVDGGYTR